LAASRRARAVVKEEGADADADDEEEEG